MESEAVVDKVMRVKHKIASKRGTRSIKKWEQLWATKPSQIDTSIFLCIETSFLKCVIIMRIYVYHKLLRHVNFQFLSY